MFFFNFVCLLQTLISVNYFSKKNHVPDGVVYGDELELTDWITKLYKRNSLMEVRISCKNNTKRN